MSNQKKFGVWMDGRNATIVASDNADNEAFNVAGHVTGEAGSGSSSEKVSNNQDIMLQNKFFKEIATHLVNATDVHVTGTGQAQEQFIHYLAETPQFKNTRTTECTSNKMSDERLVEFIEEKMK